MRRSKFDQDWELALRERKEKVLSFQKDSEKSTYFFGITLKKGKPIRHIVKDIQYLPSDSFDIKQFESIPSEAQKIADQLLSEWDGIIKKEPDTESVIISKPKTDVFQEGSVARHMSNGREHMSIVLKIRPNGMVPSLFFTSNPEWSRGSRKRKCRKATKEEIALAGMVHSKETYLTSAIRHESEFFPTGVEFPSDRVHDLYLEFYPDAYEHIGKK